LFVEAVRDYAIFMLDPQGHVGTWNAGAQLLKGYREEEIIGKHFSQFYPESDRKAHKPERELEIGAREGRVEDEGGRVRKDGSMFWANVVITALRDGGGHLTGPSSPQVSLQLPCLLSTSIRLEFALHPWHLST